MTDLLPTLIFYLFSTVTVLSGVMAIAYAVEGHSPGTLLAKLDRCGPGRASGHRLFAGLRLHRAIFEIPALPPRKFA